MCQAKIVISAAVQGGASHQTIAWRRMCIYIYIAPCRQDGDDAYGLQPCAGRRLPESEVSIVGQSKSGQSMNPRVFSTWKAKGAQSVVSTKIKIIRGRKEGTNLID